MKSVRERMVMTNNDRNKRGNQSIAKGASANSKINYKKPVE